MDHERGVSQPSTGHKEIFLNSDDRHVHMNADTKSEDGHGGGELMHLMSVAFDIHKTFGRQRCIRWILA